jgi:hypothetical protein
MRGWVRRSREVFQKVLNTRGNEQADTHFHEVSSRLAEEALFRPTRNRTKALFNLTAKNSEFAFLELSCENRGFWYVA